MLPDRVELIRELAAGTTLVKLKRKLAKGARAKAKVSVLFRDEVGNEARKRISVKLR